MKVAVMTSHETLMDTALPGCIKRVVITETGQRVSLFHADGLDVLQGLLSLVLKDAPGPWVTVCETHYQLAGHESQAVAEGKLLMPSAWCPSCAAQRTNKQ
jgi:cell wall assembly regulator SMI1